MEQVTLTICGRVQGVGFRLMTKSKAQEIKLTGYVQNESDGCVRCVAQGSKKKIEDLIEWIQANPGLSHIETIEKHWEKPQEKHTKFIIIRDHNVFADQAKSFTNLRKKIFG